MAANAAPPNGYQRVYDAGTYNFQMPSYTYGDTPPVMLRANYTPLVAAEGSAHLGAASLNSPLNAPGVYDKIRQRYEQMGTAILGLSIAQMIIWFPLGFLYFLGISPRSGKPHMAVGIVFFILSMAAFITILSITYCSSYSYCFETKFFAFICIPHIALSIASIAIGSNHRKLELLLRALNLHRFALDYPERVLGSEATF